MTGYLEEVRGALVAWDQSRPRSLQQTIGWSEAMDCRAALGYKLSGEWETDDTDTWRAIVGSLLHQGVQEIRGKQNPDLRFEVDTVYRGIPGHADEVGPDWVTDYKFPTVAVKDTWARDPHGEAFASARAQGHGYAAGLIAAGILPEVCTVNVLVCPVDAGFAEWWLWSEPFDRAVADTAAARLDDVKATHAAGGWLPREKPVAFCERFCGFFTTCRGADGPVSELISDPETVSMVDRYAEIGAVLGPLEKEKKRIALEIRGVRGITPAGVRVSMSEPSGTKPVPDLERIRRDYEASGIPLPTADVPTSSPSLQVRRPKR